jgi:hypothetical protein
MERERERETGLACLRGWKRWTSTEHARRRRRGSKTFCKRQGRGIRGSSSSVQARSWVRFLDFQCGDRRAVPSIRQSGGRLKTTRRVQKLPAAWCGGREWMFGPAQVGAKYTVSRGLCRPVQADGRQGSDEESGDLGRCDEWMHCVQRPNPIHQVGALFYERDTLVSDCPWCAVLFQEPGSWEKEKKEKKWTPSGRLDWLQSGWRFRFSSRAVQLEDRSQVSGWRRHASNSAGGSWGLVLYGVTTGTQGSAPQLPQRDLALKR